MDENSRRRSSRLRKLQDVDNDDDSKCIDRRTGKDTTSSKQKSKATKNPTAQTTSGSQSIGRRRTRSSSSIDSESMSSLTTNKRSKRTSVSKSELSVSTNTTTNQSTTMTNRRRTRSFSKQMQTKNVTPSPVPSTTTPKFNFKSTRKATDRRSNTPTGVVNLYRDQENENENETGTSLAAFESPTNPGSRKRRGLTRQGKQQQQKNDSEHRGRPMVSTKGGYGASSSTPESATIDYIRTYGEDYWQSLHDSERPIIHDPSALESSNEIKKDKPNPETPNSSNRNNLVGSPESRRSTSSSSTCTSKVTPNDETSFELAFIAPDYRRIQKKKNLQPHQSHESTTAMSIQPQLTPKMRSILVDWLIELSEHFSFGPATLHLAVTMVDRVLASGRLLEQQNSSSTERHRRSSNFLSTHDDYDDSDSYFSESDNESNHDESEEDNESKDTRCYMIPRDRFQLLGATCVWLACKVEETTPPKAREIAYVSDHIYSVEQITRMERRICNALNFTFFEAPTPHQFLFEFMRASLVGCAPEQQERKWASIPAAATGVGLATDSIFRDMVHYLLELGRLPYGPTGRNPSLLAAAAVYLARVTLGIPRALKDAAESASAVSNSPTLASPSDSDSDSSLDPFSYNWTPTLKYYTGYTQSDLRDTVTEIHEYHMAAESSALKAVFNKYKVKKFHRVAHKTVVRVEDLGFS
jgi:hypothetical protein